MKFLKIFLILFLLEGIILGQPKTVSADDFLCCPDWAPLRSGQCVRKFTDDPLPPSPSACRENQLCNASTGKCDSPAGSAESVFGEISAPDFLQPLVNKGGAGGIGFFLTQVIGLIYVAATIIFVFMILISGFQWIISGGDKEAVGKARGRLIWAIIGITILALAFVIIRAIGQITGFTFFEGQNAEQRPIVTEENPRGGPLTNPDAYR